MVGVYRLRRTVGLADPPLLFDDGGGGVTAEVKLHLAPGGSTIEVDGVDVAKVTRSVTVEHVAGGLPVVALEYACHSVHVQGELDVVHVCGLAGTDA